ncbi:MAG TPA: protein kinase [Ktedonobacteraceae bacterium]|nr:protein kinase [Ktedonobacteraceae bacterium]
MSDRIGQYLGNYQLISLLGRGGFAEVYLAEHRRLGTQAAIKVFYTHIAASEEETFLAEARTIAHLEHPHIVRILDFDVQEGAPFLVMGYAPNGTLRQRHPKGTRLPPHLVLDYLKQIAAALQYAHDEKVIHRDIKPENMLLGRHDEVLLSDFGSALIAQSSRLQGTQEVLGTASYMAPEQLLGKPRLASDQYSLGVVAYEWLTGEHPFHGTFLELYSQHLSVPPPSLRSKIPALPPELDQVILTALAKDPTRRFASVQAFATAFEQAHLTSLASASSAQTEPEPTSIVLVRPTEAVSQATPSSPTIVTSPQAIPARANPHSPTPSPAEPAKTNPRPPTPAEAAFVLQPLDPISAPDPLPQAVIPAPREDVPPSSSQSVSQIANLPTTPPRAAQPSSKSPKQGRRISRRRVFIGLTTLAILGGVSGGTWVLYSQWPREGSIVYTYRGHSDIVTSAAWSPDSKRIASGSFDKTVQVWNATTGSSPFTYPGHSNTVTCVAWSPDGKLIASSSFDKTVQVWPPLRSSSEGNSLYTYHGHSDIVYALAWSPDGKRIASGGFDKTVRVWNAFDGSSLFTYKGHSGTVTAISWSPDGKLIASGGFDKTVQVWNAIDGSSPYIYRGHSGPVNAVTWSPDSKRIASASFDSTVQVWNVINSNSSFTYLGHSNAVTAVSWSPDSKLIASGGVDTTVQVWPAATGNSPYIYRGHSAPVNAVSWSPDSKLIASGSADKTVQVWQGP